MVASSSDMPASNQGPTKGNGGKANDLRFRSQFKKTELCAFHTQGWCSKGARCEFAHGDHELKTVPNLTKTSLCRRWLNHTCKFSSSECRFAHGAQEQRITQAYVNPAAGTGKRSARKRGNAEGSMQTPNSQEGNNSAVGQRQTLSMALCLGTDTPRQDLHTLPPPSPPLVGTQPPLPSPQLSPLPTQIAVVAFWQTAPTPVLLQAAPAAPAAPAQVVVAEASPLSSPASSGGRGSTISLDCARSPGLALGQAVPVTAVVPAPMPALPTPDEVEAMLIQAMPDHYDD